MNTSQPSYWARLKPYNPKYGQRLKRCFYLGRLWAGGDGVHEIPEWVRVNPAQAVELRKLRQDCTCDYNPDIKRAFDVVTQEQKDIIDRREETYRRAALGFGAPNITEMPDISPREVDASGQQQPAGRITLEDLEGAPAPSIPVLDDDEESIGQIADMPSVPDLKPAEVDISGRVAAAEGFEAPGTHDLNDGQDVDEVAPQHGKEAGEQPTKLRAKSSKARGSGSRSRSRGK